MDMDLEQNTINEQFQDFVIGYQNIVTLGFDERWSKVKQEIYDKHITETIGALLSRQATLSIEMAKAPTTWNAHIAPIFLRCMVEAYISFAWILAAPNERSKKFIEYGLGQEKLFVEFLEEALREEPNAHDSQTLKDMIEMRKGWLNAQLADWATEVNVGSWSGMSAREMAKEIGRESIYKHAYVPFSGATHNMWQHVGIYNVEPCTNPLHKWHVVPKIQQSHFHPDFMYRSAKYISMTFQLFDEKMDINCEIQLPDEYFLGQDLFFNDPESN